MRQPIKMALRRGKATCKADSLNEVSPIALAICRSSIAVSSVVQTSLAIYLLKVRVTETLDVVTDTLIILSVSRQDSRHIALFNSLQSTISLLYCAFYSCFFKNRKPPLNKLEKRANDKIFLTGLFFIAILWLATFTLSFVVAVKNCVEQYSSRYSRPNDDRYFKIQLANAVGALLAL